MPLVIRPRNRRRLSLLAAPAAVFAIACGATAGGAEAAPTASTTTTTGCPAPSSWQAFAGFGDTAHYTLAPGGSFEVGGEPWTLNGNTVVAGNEPFQLNAATDVRSLSIKPGTSVLSPSFCVDHTNPFLRLVAKKATIGNLKVELVYTDPSTASTTYKTAGNVIMGGFNQNGDYSAWAPSPKLDLATMLPLAKSATGTLNVKVRITANTKAGDWLVDDVFVDPFRAG